MVCCLPCTNSPSFVGLSGTSLYHTLSHLSVTDANPVRFQEEARPVQEQDHLRVSNLNTITEVVCGGGDKATDTPMPNSGVPVSDPGALHQLHRWGVVVVVVIVGEIWKDGKGTVQTQISPSVPCSGSIRPLQMNWTDLKVRKITASPLKTFHPWYCIN